VKGSNLYEWIRETLILHGQEKSHKADLAPGKFGRILEMEYNGRIHS